MLNLFKMKQFHALNLIKVHAGFKTDAKVHLDLSQV